MTRQHTVTLSLISHTNVGKTTLARTLLRRDVGQTGDRPHVTDLSEAHVMVATQGCRLLLWDTPGFGDSARLIRRLQTSQQPIFWMLTQIWDRFTNRPLWCSQQAMKNVRDEADVVLYLVDASQSPEEAAYVAMEMQILTWADKPVVLLLNQTGAPRAAEVEAAEEKRWLDHLARYPVVKSVLNLDAFARCWVQESELLEVLAPIVPEEKKDSFAKLRHAWHQKNLVVHQEALDVLSRSLVSSLFDEIEVKPTTFLQKIGLNRAEVDAEMKSARQELTTRLHHRLVDATNELIRLFGLEGHASPEGQSMQVGQFGLPDKINEPMWSAIGGLAAGLTTGLMADFIAHGFTFFGGAVLGAIGGGTSAYMMAKTYNLVRGTNGNDVRWSAAHFIEQVQLTLLCYLAVSHYGRGRGHWSEGEHPEHWRDLVRETVAQLEERIHQAWKMVGDKKNDQAVTLEEVKKRIDSLMTDACAQLLRQLYPNVEIYRPILVPAELPAPALADHAETAPQTSLG
jgi:GTPase SAR1 family protein